MTFATITTNFADTGFNTGKNTNLLATAMTQGLVVTGIDVIGGFNFQTAAGLDAYQFLNYLQFGIQWGPQGYTHVDLTSNPDASNWLVNEGVQPTQGGLVTPNDTAANNAVAERYSFALRWRGQLLLPQNSDFYFSEGSNLGSGVTGWKLNAVGRVFYDSGF